MGSENEKLALINPPLDEGRGLCIDAGYWQPLNLLTLGSYLRKNGFEGEMKLFDREVQTREALLRDLDEFAPTTVGLSPTIDSYRTTLQIAHDRKEKGARVVVGGNYSTGLSDQIVRTREDIDCVVVNDGEEPLQRILEGKDFKDIPNLVFRGSGGEVVKTPVQYASTASKTALDYSLVDLPQYFANYAKSPNPGRFKNPLTVLSQRGCAWRDVTGGCVFCSRIEPQSVYDAPPTVWSRLEEYRDRHGVDALIDVGDDFIGNKNWFAEFYATRPLSMEDIGIRFIYSRSNNITTENADRLAAMHTQEVFLGLESGDSAVLKHTVKGNSPQNHLRTLALLKERGIQAIAAFVLGLPGESKDSLQRTKDHIAKVMDMGNISELIVGSMTPLPLAPAWDQLMAVPGMRQKYGESDVLDLEGLQKEWLAKYCEVGMDEIYRLIEDVTKQYKHTVFDFDARGAQG